MKEKYQQARKYVNPSIWDEKIDINIAGFSKEEIQIELCERDSVRYLSVDVKPDCSINVHREFYPVLIDLESEFATIESAILKNGILTIKYKRNIPTTKITKIEIGE